MGKKTFSATGRQSVVQYIPPRLVKATQGWYVVFYTVHPQTLALERHRRSFNLGRIQKKKDRQIRAEALMSALEELIPLGYPWIGDVVVYEIDRFIALRKQQPANVPALKAEKPVLECLKFVTDLKCQSDRKETRKTYKNAFDRLSDFLLKNNLESVPVNQFGLEYAQAYMDHVRLRVGNNTYNNYRGQTIVLFNAMKDRGMIAANPFLKTPKMPKVKKLRRPFSVEDAAVVLLEIYETDYWLFILVLLHLGEFVRRTEAYRLRFNRFNLQQGYMTITEDDSKNRQENTVTIPQELLVFFLDERFTGWPSNYLLFGEGGLPDAQKSAGENTFKNRHRQVLLRLKAAGKLTDITGLSLYSWKDTGMTFMAKFLTPFQLRDHARHSSADISMRYYHADKIIPEIRAARLPFLEEIIERQKARLKSD